MKKLILIFICLVIFIGVVHFLNIGLRKQEQVECLKWKEQSEEYPLFYVLPWQREQCEYHSIFFDK